MSVQPDGTPARPVTPVVVSPATTGAVQGWVQAVGFLLTSFALVLLSVAVVRNPSAPVAAPDGAGKVPVRPGSDSPPVLPPSGRPPVVPAARSEVAKAAVAYRDGLGNSFSALAGKIRGGEMKTVDAIGTAFRENGLSLANPLHAMILTHCDAAGNVTDPAGLADELRAVADALGAK